MDKCENLDFGASFGTKSPAEMSSLLQVAFFPYEDKRSRSGLFGPTGAVGAAAVPTAVTASARRLASGRVGLDEAATAAA